MCFLFFPGFYLHKKSAHTLGFWLQGNWNLKEKWFTAHTKQKFSGNSRDSQHLSKFNKEKYIIFYHVIKTDGAKHGFYSDLQRQRSEPHPSGPMWDILIKQTSYREKGWNNSTPRDFQGESNHQLKQKAKSSTLRNGIYVGYIFFLLLFVVQLQ